MAISKSIISRPIEAGKSILDVNELPQEVANAMEYISARLTRKRVNLTMILVRKDSFLQSPQTSPRLFSSTSSPQSSPPVSPISYQGSFDELSLRDMTPSPSPSLSRTRWASLPSTPRPPRPPPSPALSIISTTSSTYSMSAPLPKNPWCLSFMQTSALTEREDRILRETISKAERKFFIGSGWLPDDDLTEETSCVIINDLIRRSLRQNEVLYSTESLTLLSLDYLYVFKSALHVLSNSVSSPLTPTPNYPFTSDSSLLSDAADALRRLVLSQQGRRISQTYLQRCYEYIQVPLSIMVEVNESYKITYGGPQAIGGIAMVNEQRRVVSINPPVQQTSTTAICHPRARRPALALDVNVVPRSQTREFPQVGEMGIQRLDRGPHVRGPMTPNGFEDITPVTRGEWCFLMVGDGWKDGRRAGLGLC